MKIAIDFDGTLVDDDHAYDDLDTPLRLKPGAKEALVALRAAKHILILWSGRANRALREDWRLNPLWRHGIVGFDPEKWEARKAVNVARHQQMLDFVDAELPDLFHYIDDGMQGKVSADLFLDDRALRMISGPTSRSWEQVAKLWGKMS